MTAYLGIILRQRGKMWDMYVRGDSCIRVGKYELTKTFRKYTRAVQYGQAMIKKTRDKSPQTLCTFIYPNIEL